MHQHQLSAAGGTDAVRYFVSDRSWDRMVPSSVPRFNRYSFRSNLDAQLKKWLKLGVNAMYSQTDERLGLADSQGGVINYSLLTPPDIPIYDLDGNYASVIREGYTRINPIAMVLDEDILLGRNKLNGSIFADITPIENLTWHSELGFDIGSSRGERFEPAVQYGKWSREKNMSSVQKNDNRFWQLKNYLTYSGNMDKHDYTVMLGQEMWGRPMIPERDRLALPSNDIKNPGLGRSFGQFGFGNVPWLLSSDVVPIATTTVTPGTYTTV